MTQREHHLRKLVDDLDLAEAEVTKMREQLANAPAGEAPAWGQELEKLTLRLNDLRRDLHAEQSAAGGSWDEVRTGLDLTWREIKTGLEMLLGSSQASGEDRR